MSTIGTSRVWILACMLAGAACGDDSGADGGAAGASAAADSGQPQDAGAPDAAASGSACAPRVEEHAHDNLPAMHITVPLPPSAYNSSPPSSGPHCGHWGAYEVFDADSPLPACNYVHNLEHGAIALLYACPDGCSEIASALEQVIDEAPPDPDCGANKRLLLTPYPDMEVTVAAAAWGYTFTADCLDDAARTALLEFITTYWGSRGDSPEPMVCSDGAIVPER